jgi:hypothetical protein
VSELELSTASAKARASYLEGLALLLAAKPLPEAAFRRSVTEDPQFALAYAGEARSLFVIAKVAEAKISAAMARDLSKNLPERERNNIEVNLLPIEGGAAKAYALARDHLKQYPRDAMVVAPCTGVFGLIGFSGRKGREQEMRDLLEELAPHWGEEPWFLAQLAFARVETGDIEGARKTIERSLALDPRSAHGAHVMAHVHYEAGEKVAGLKFLQKWIPDYAKEGLLHCHLNWHVALWQLELGDAEAAMGTYLKAVHPGASWGPPINTLSDAASFLWRAELAGRPRDLGRWTEISDYGTANFPGAGLAFADAHRALAYAATGDDAGLQKLLSQLRERQAAGKLLAGPVVPALAEGFGAFAKKDYQ